MKNLELKRQAMLKLTILVLFVFSSYPSTEGNKIEDVESYADSSEIEEDLEPYNDCFSEPGLNKTIESCLAGVLDASPGFATVEECTKELKPTVICFVNALDTCGVHSRLRAAIIIYFNKFVLTRACLEVLENN